MREVPPDGFDAAVCMGNSFGYLDPEGTRTFVAALAAAVRPGGGLVVDFSAAAESVLPGFTGEDRTHERRATSASPPTTEYDVAHSRLVSGYRFSRGAEEVAVTALHHVLTCAQIDDLLTDGGLRRHRALRGPGRGTVPAGFAAPAAHRPQALTAASQSGSPPRRAHGVCAVRDRSARLRADPFWERGS